MLRRVYLIDVLTCPSCQGRRTLLAAIHDPDSIRRMRHHLGLPAGVVFARRGAPNVHRRRSGLAQRAPSATIFAPK